MLLETFWVVRVFFLRADLLYGYACCFSSSHASPVFCFEYSQKVKFQELSNDDYFSKNNEFATWLKEEKNVFFSDLSTGTAHDLFSQFVKAWNSQQLESRYYEGIEAGPRTAHKWRIKQ